MFGCCTFTLCHKNEPFLFEFSIPIVFQCNLYSNVVGVAVAVAVPVPRAALWGTIAVLSRMRSTSPPLSYIYRSVELKISFILFIPNYIYKKINF